MSDFVNKLSEIEAEQKEIRERAVNIEKVVNSLEGVQVVEKEKPFFFNSSWKLCVFTLWFLN